MKHFLATLYVTIEAESEEQAKAIALNLSVLPKNKADKEKVLWDAENATTIEPFP